MCQTGRVGVFFINNDALIPLVQCMMYHFHVGTMVKVRYGSINACCNLFLLVSLSLAKQSYPSERGRLFSIYTCIFLYLPRR